MSDYLQPRIYGGEMEYGLVMKPGEFPLEGGLSSDILRRALPRGISGYGQFLSNGARFYMDIGNHPEYATPECTTLDEIVAHELAGEMIVAETFERIQSRGFIKGLQINKRVADAKGEHWGSHENFFVSDDLDDYDILFPLALHYATRSIWAGAGMMRGGTFQVAQKMESIDSLASGYASSRTERPLINLNRSKQDPLTQNSGGRRVHIACGDANVWPWAIRMKYGTTSLILRMVEFGVDLSDLFLDDEVQAAKAVAVDTTLTTPIRTERQKYVTALDIQEALAIRAYKLSQKVELPTEEIEVIHEWLKICNDLRADADACGERVEWLAKKQVIDGVMSRHQEIDRHDPRLAGIDVRWDITSPLTQLGHGIRLRERELVEGLPDVLDIENAKTEPPQTSRARIRGGFVTALVEHKLSGDVEWEKLVIHGIKRGVFRIDNPFIPHHHRLERTLRKLNRR